MARKKKRRIRSPHPGVVILRRTLPAGGIAWRARFRDPDTGKLVYDTLDPQELSTHEARADWAKRKSRALARRRAELAVGAPLRTRTPLPEAVKTYLETCKANRLRDRTLEVYRVAADKLVEWAKENGVQTVEALTPARISAFRDSRASQRRQVVASGEKGRGTAVNGRQPGTRQSWQRPCLPA